MADNYLESRMEQHRLQAGAPKRVPAGGGTRPGHLDVALQPLTAIFIGGSEQLSATAARAVAAGYKVTVITVDPLTATAATEAGARVYKVDSYDDNVLANIARDRLYDWKRIDLLVYHDGERGGDSMARPVIRERDSYPVPHSHPLQVLSLTEVMYTVGAYTFPTPEKVAMMALVLTSRTMRSTKR